MHVRTDYETEDILAVFGDAEAARSAARGVRAMVNDPHRVTVLPLKPGRYQLADTRLQEVVHGAVRSARISVPAGALTGLGLAAMSLPGIGPGALAGMAAAGALGGLVVGGMIGAINRTRWDRDPANFIEVPPDASHMLVLVRASSAPARRETSRVIGALVRARALAFLDPTAYYATAGSDELVPA
jgi:outer membrane lipoprotein SlyB